MSFNIYGDDENWIINLDHSEMNFSISYLKVSEVTGRFKSFSGFVILGESIKASEIEINVNSIDTGNSKRDKHLIGKSFFSVNRWGKITFKLLGVKRNTIIGRLVIRNKSLPIEAHYKLSEEVRDTWGKISRFIHFNFMFKRSQFGLNWNKVLDTGNYLVGDDLRINGRFQIQKEKLVTSSFKHLIPDTKSIRQRDGLKLDGKSIEDYSQTLNYTKESQIGKSRNLSLECAAHCPKEEKIKYIYKEKKRSFFWWASYILLASFSLICFVFFLMNGKMFFIERWPDLYEETSFLGIFTDFLLYPFLMIYAFAIWYLGFS